MRIVDMGTGVNSQIIATSTRWRFDFITGIILLCLTLPFNYILTKYYFGIIGPAISNLISFSIYNAIRYWFLFKKYKLQPFTLKTLYTIILGLSGYYGCYLLFNNIHGIAGMMIRSTVFVLLFGAAVIALRLSPDLLPIWHTIQKKLGIKKGDSAAPLINNLKARIHHFSFQE